MPAKKKLENTAMSATELHKKFLENQHKLSPEQLDKIGDLLSDMIAKTDAVLSQFIKPAKTKKKKHGNKK